MREKTPEREAIGEAPNPLGLDGIEYIEYSTSRPQALGQVLETMGFKPVSRHRSREVLLYRQGGMNIVVNAHAGVVRGSTATDEPAPAIRALALRVRDARVAYERALELGAWDVPMHAQVMELNIPGIHGPGGAHLYFVDRYKDFSIYSVDFVPIPGVDPNPPVVAGLHYFGLVQYIGRDRTDDWTDFYGRLFGFLRLPDETRFGILPKGTLLQSPGDLRTHFYLQLIEPDPATLVYDEEEKFQRIGFGTRDVPAAVVALRQQGVEFVDTDHVKVTPQGALTRGVLQSVSFELVHDERP
ncbi:MAG: 4-hydroxyphenylpyruvate dioxygenase [Rubrivivax sp.]|nr:4-hydroxyphenylpyruvate dioxygenase [Rubrivivax sp.]MDH5339443.1 4-hydroxyphenylpyruvate dioxygenase [Rubrivivax sp.]